MTLLRAGVDTSVIAVWLGHEKTDTVQIYLHADLTLKDEHSHAPRPAAQPPAATSPPTTCSHSWRPCDYAERAETKHHPRNTSHHRLGIIGNSE